MTVERALVGRGHELAELGAVLDLARVGTGGLVVVEGETGIGKTRLLHETYVRARGYGFGVAAGAGHELSADRPFAALAGAGRQGVAVPSQPCPSALLRAAGNPPVEEIVSLFRRDALRRPLVIAIDDAHWADRASLDVLERIAHQGAHLPIVVLVAHRPRPLSEALGQLRRAVAPLRPLRLALRPLAVADVAALAGDILGAAPDDRLLDSLRAAGGNPLYLRELLSPPCHVAGDGRGAAAGAAPASVRVLVLDRLASLPPGTSHLLRMASVLGGHFTVADLATVLGRLPSEIVALVEPALGDGLLDEGGSGLEFRHPLVRETVYTALPLAVRQALHVQFGRALAAAGAPPETVATHLRLGGAGPAAPAPAIDLVGRPCPAPAVPRRRSRLGWQAVTATERDVAKLVADGLTSREIGAHLFMSRRTVETHLAHMFAKLGISSRVELAIAYTRAADGGA